MKRSIAHLMMRTALTAAVLAGLPGGMRQAGAQIAADRNVVVDFAANNVGNKIGGGECTDLVNAALNAANAKTLEKRPARSYEIKRGLPSEIYIWGTRVVALGKSRPVYQPGYIIQFEGCNFRKPDGSQTWDLPHHTAIVKSANGTNVTLLHQNAPKGSVVNEITLDLAWMVAGPTGKSGSYAIYMPIRK